MATPVVTKKKDFVRPPQFNFPQAMQAVIDGNKVTKREWNSDQTYVYIGVDPENGAKFLFLHKDDGKDYIWEISEADMLGEDYALLA